MVRHVQGAFEDLSGRAHEAGLAQLRVRVRSAELDVHLDAARGVLHGHAMGAGARPPLRAMGHRARQGERRSHADGARGRMRAVAAPGREVARDDLAGPGAGRDDHGLGQHAARYVAQAHAQAGRAAQGLQAREERNRTEPYRYSVVGSEKVALGRAIGTHLELEITNLTRTFEELRSDRLTRAAELLGEAPRVWLLGLGAEEGLARYARLLLARLRHNVMMLGMNGNAWAEDLAMTGPRDALVLVTLEPRPRILKPILSYARTTRMNVITITDRNYLLQAQRYSAVVLPCHVSSFGLGPSHTSVASALRLLSIAFAAYAGDTALQRLEIISGIHEELDDTE